VIWEASDVLSTVIVNYNTIDKCKPFLLGFFIDVLGEVINILRISIVLAI